MKSVNVSPILYLIWSNILLISNSKMLKFKFNDRVHISHCETAIWKCYIPIWTKEVFAIKIVKIRVQKTPFLQGPNSEEIIGTIYKHCRRINKC